ncbi:hypothetical protein M422DRAFT_70891 [Sphaerobolus stellatus SS14]|uniref:TPR-like protein n=1 Tax=Sphaerobolus stellatus (strain SS14) TaxID=990650 RepID=A0A0C9V1A3_SPHS4|nr:hypothetical protein M422DRAFT_70891 [Sphaerobolus stellatus SS14]
MALTAEEKIQLAEGLKQAGDDAFRTNDVQTALRKYHESLLYLNGLDKSALPVSLGGGDELPNEDGDKPKGKVNELLDKIYSNQSACYIKKKNWKRAIEAADKALSKNKDNHKALFRRAKANGEMGFLEKATKLFEELREKSTDDNEKNLIDQELNRMQLEDARRRKQVDSSLRGFLNK